MELVADKYKKTEIGLIPSDWDVKKLSSLCSLSKTRINPVNSKINHKCVELEHLSQETGMLLGLANSKDLKSQKTVFYKGDVLFGKLRPYLKKFLYADFDGVCTTEIWVLKPSDEIQDKLLYYLIQTDSILEAANQTEGTKMPRADWKIVGEAKIPFPPTRTEQTTIASALHDADTLITELEKLIAKKKAIKQGAMQELLKPKDGWEVKKLGDLLDYEQPTKYLVVDTEYNDHNQLPVLTAGKSFILGYTNEEFGIFTNLPVIIFDDFITSSKFVNFPFKVKSSAMKMLKPKSGNVNLRFVFELMQTIKFNSTDHKRYWISEYQNVEVKVPDPKEQTRIAQILYDMDTEIEAMEKKSEKYKMLKQGMMQNLLTGRIRLI